MCNVKKRHLVVVFGAFLMVSVPLSVFARDITFTWTANPDTVDGYKLYYKTGGSGPPYDGTGALEGPSPVATGNVTTFTLHNLADKETYYFAITATNGTLESDYSEELVSQGAPSINIIQVK